MRRVIAIDLFEGTAWYDATSIIGDVGSGEVDTWLMVQRDSVRVVPEWADGLQVLRAAANGGPSFHCRVWHASGGPDRPTVYTVDVRDVDMYSEVLLDLGFRLGPPDGIELRKDERGAYWGYYV